MEWNPEMLPAGLAVSSAFLFALAVQMQNLGLKHADPRTGTLISITATAAVYWLVAPLFTFSMYWLTVGALWFALVGLFRPALSARLAMSGIKYLGPTLTSGLAATNPIFAAAAAVIILGELLTLPVAVGTAAVVMGVFVASFAPGGIRRGWPLWAIALPLGAAFFRAIGHPITMIGYETAPSPYFAGLVSYSVSFVVSLGAYNLGRRKLPPLSPGMGWFALAGIINGLSLYCLNTALATGKLLTVAPIVSSSPVFAMALGLYVFKKEIITWRTVATIGLVVPGVVIVVVYG